MSIFNNEIYNYSSSIEGRLVRSYKRSFNGFVARLTESERERVAGECSSTHK